MAIKVEQNIPIPPIAQNARVSKYPYMQMEVGDSFSVSAETESAESGETIDNGTLRRRMRQSLNWANKRYASEGRKFSSRFDGACVRIWRVQ